MNIDDIKAKIISANSAYRSGTPIMSDQAFDDLCDEYQKLVSEDEWNKFRDSLHELAGKVKHPFVMGSLDKLKAESPDDVIKFINSYCKSSLNVSAKVDGISCRLHYENGKLVSASSRGDGTYGEDLTCKARYVKFVPLNVDDMNLLGKSFDIRGELVILKDDFANMSGFSNPRNAVAGLMGRKEWKVDDMKNVSFIAYTILGDGFTKISQFKTLDMWGFKTAWSTEIERPCNKIVDELFELASQDFEYEIDGLVICDSEYVNEDKYRPDACKAFKINQLSGVTRLLDVVFEGPSKNGLHVPVGILDPVELGGAVISRVSLYNVDFIKQMGLKYGSKVEVLKSGDVIPKLVRVVENDEKCNDIMLPEVCNCCGSQLVHEGVTLCCKNKKCPDQVVNQLALFIKKLGVKSASNATLKNFGIASFEGLVKFEPDKKYKSEMKLAAELKDKMFTRSFNTLLCNMTCFEGVAETTVEKMLDFYGHDMIASHMHECASGYEVDKSLKEDMLKVGLPSGVGEPTLDKFIEGLQDAWTYANLIIHDTRWNDLEGTQDSSRDECASKGSICVTGSLKFGSRSKFLEFAKVHGYESKAGVSKGLTYLITNDAQSGSSKNRKARELGVKVITEDEFMKLVNDSEIESSLSDF